MITPASLLRLLLVLAFAVWFGQILNHKYMELAEVIGRIGARLP